jgi:hypothetical protein
MPQRIRLFRPSIERFKFPKSIFRTVTINYRGGLQMKKWIQSMLAVWALCLGLTVLTACGPKPILSVNYRLPATTSSLEGLATSLDFVDGREDPSFLSPTARQELDEFSEIFSLVVSGESTGENLIGAYRIPELFLEILSRRLEQTGMRVGPSNSGTYTIEFLLNDFYLDLVERRWKARMNYQIRLMRDGSLLTQQTVSGSAERARLTGQKDAEKIISELVSDMINRIDVSMLAEHMQ